MAHKEPDGETDPRVTRNYFPLREAWARVQDAFGLQANRTAYRCPPSCGQSRNSCVLNPLNWMRFDSTFPKTLVKQFTQPFIVAL